jgi:hypothetical protein
MSSTLILHAAVEPFHAMLATAMTHQLQPNVLPVEGATFSSLWLVGGSSRAMILSALPWFIFLPRLYSCGIIYDAETNSSFKFCV